MQVLRTTVFEHTPGKARITIVWKRADDSIVEHWYEMDVATLMGFQTKVNGVLNMMLRHAPRPDPADHVNHHPV